MDFNLVFLLVEFRSRLDLRRKLTRVIFDATVDFPTTPVAGPRFDLGLLVPVSLSAAFFGRRLSRFWEKNENSDFDSTSNFQINFFVVRTNREF